MKTDEIKQSLFDVLINLILGMFSSLLFLIFNYWIKLSIVISLPVSIIVFVILFIICSRKQRENVIRLVATTPEVKDLLRSVLNKMNVISHYTDKITDEMILFKLKKVNEVTQRIFEVLQRDPRKVKSARQFTSCYLESTIKVLKSYIDLRDNGLNEIELNTLLGKISSLLSDLEIAYSKQLDKLLRNDILNLNTEVEVLETFIKSEV
jgi:5-bromo-4-chloroindolyl phosphate hydrolysis protein